MPPRSSGPRSSCPRTSSHGRLGEYLHGAICAGDDDGAVGDFDGGVFAVGESVGAGAHGSVLLLGRLVRRFRRGPRWRWLDTQSCNRLVTVRVVGVGTGPNLSKAAPFLYEGEDAARPRTSGGGPALPPGPGRA